MRVLLLLLSIFSTSYLSAQHNRTFVPLLCNQKQMQSQEIKKMTSIFHVYQGDNPQRDNAKTVEIYSVAPKWEWVEMDKADCKSKQYIGCMCAVSLTPAETMLFDTVEDVSNLDPSLYTTTKLTYEQSNLPFRDIPIICFHRRPDIRLKIIDKLKEDGYFEFTPVQGNSFDSYFEAQLMDYRTRYELNTDYIWAADIVDHMNLDVERGMKTIVVNTSYSPSNMIGGKCYSKSSIRDSKRTIVQELKYPVYVGNDLSVETEWVSMFTNVPMIGMEVKKTGDVNYVTCAVEWEDRKYENIEVLLRSDGLQSVDVEYRTFFKDVPNPDAKDRWVEVLCKNQLTESIIENIQVALVREGFLETGGFRSSGYDLATRAAVIAFQKDKKIPSGPLSLKTLRLLKVNVPKEEN